MRYLHLMAHSGGQGAAAAPLQAARTFGTPRAGPHGAVTPDMDAQRRWMAPAVVDERRYASRHEQSWRWAQTLRLGRLWTAPRIWSAGLKGK